jgi:transglycosylase-like protein with SLT domain
LPATFFIRLLYQESSFKLGVVSSAGALGIAQFMPETAADRGVDNPLDALQAIPASAELLRDLYLKFGNLGLAAAAYNAEPKRIQDWLAKRASLPPETQKYVKIVTGWPAETWAAGEAGSLGLKLPQDAPCQDVADLLPSNRSDKSSLPAGERRPKTP